MNPKPANIAFLTIALSVLAVYFHSIDMGAGMDFLICFIVSILCILMAVMSFFRYSKTSAFFVSILSLGYWGWFVWLIFINNASVNMN
jgi:UDP-N-acetylmuramyl pentapeptide phosphotransferase/UDP-N-acetylglucosamine-1-phosphate transferase